MLGGEDEGGVGEGGRGLGGAGRGGGIGLGGGLGLQAGGRDGGLQVDSDGQQASTPTVVRHPTRPWSCRAHHCFPGAHAVESWTHR